MKFSSKFVVLLAGIFSACLAFGGGGAGGGVFGKTTLLLQAHDYEQAFLTFEGGTALPEDEFTPQLTIPEDEYGAFVKEYENAVSTKTPYVLPPVTGDDGKVRTYQLLNAGEEGGTLFLYLKEIPN